MKFIFLILVAILFQNCSGQINQNDYCNESLARAKRYVANYAILSDTSYLNMALKSLDTSLVCPKSRNKSIEMAISIYFLHKNYESGKHFVESLKSDDFYFSYQKNFYSGLFNASILEENGDTVSKISQYKKMGDEIDLFISENKREGLEMEVFLNLFFVLSKYQTVEELKAKHVHLKSQFPKQSELIDSAFLQIASQY